MREIQLLKKLNQSYKLLNLSYPKLTVAFFWMFVTSVLEMAGLSILYPLVLAFGNQSQQNLSFLPSSFTAEDQMLLLFSAVGVLYVIKNIALYFTCNNNVNFAVYYHRNLIGGLFNAYIQKPVLDFRKESSGSIANIVCVQSGRLVDGVLRPFLLITTELLVLLGISLLLLFINPLLIISVIIVCSLSVGVFYVLLRTKAHEWGKRRMWSAALMQELVNNTATGISEIKIFNKEAYLSSRVQMTAETETGMFHHLEMYQQAPRFIIETIFIVVIVSFFIVLLLLGSSPAVLLAQFSVIAAASFRILPSINRIVNAYSNFSFHIGPGLALLEMLSAAKDYLIIDNQAKSQHLFTHVEKIELQNITFQYPSSSQLIIQDVDMVIKKGERLGLVGASGSGKSTLIEILAGLYMPTLGNIVVDGYNISGDLKAWQQTIGYVPQVAFIMPGTIRDNISFGASQQSSDDDIWRVLEKVKLNKLVSSLPAGLDTDIGEKGLLLSGGQKQLICMARALFKHPSLFLLDEPTAALDEESEKVVLQAITELPLDTTIIMVSHKYENFQNFDIVYRCEHKKFVLEQMTRNNATAKVI